MYFCKPIFSEVSNETHIESWKAQALNALKNTICFDIDFHCLPPCRRRTLNTDTHTHTSLFSFLSCVVHCNFSISCLVETPSLILVNLFYFKTLGCNFHRFLMGFKPVVCLTWFFAFAFFFFLVEKN